MQVITVATDPQHYYHSMVESARRNNINITILGWGQKWQGFIWKLKLIKDKLKFVDPNEIIMFIDAYDIIFLKDQNEIIKNFLSYKKNIVFGAVCGNKSKLEKKVGDEIFYKKYNFPKKKSCFDKLNSGCYIGYAKNILDILNDICNLVDCNDEKIDDQVVMSKYYSENYDKKKIELDYNVKLVYNFECHNDFKYISDNLNRLTNNQTGEVGISGKLFTLDEKGRFFVKETNSYPCLIHGHGYTNLNSIVKYLGLPSKIKSNNFNYSYNTFINTKKIFITIFIVLLILLLLVIYKYKRKTFKKLNIF